MILGEAAGFPRYPPHRWLSGSQLIQSKGAGAICCCISQDGLIEFEFEAGVGTFQERKALSKKGQRISEENIRHTPARASFERQTLPVPFLEPFGTVWNSKLAN
jgi:hypothetical protein